MKYKVLTSIIASFALSAPAYAALSEASQQLKSLFEELQSFKDEPEFLEVGFGTCCKYRDWMEKVELLDDQSGEEIFTETQLPVREMLGRAMEYFSDNPDQELLWEFEQRFHWTLLDHELVEGEGRIVNDDRACKSAQHLEDVSRAYADQDYDGAYAILDGPDCTRVITNMVVTGPKSVNGDFVEVTIPSEEAAWITSGSVVFYGEE